ncbi:MAG: iron chelate uptake ABC transporter family permease subunit, partial [Nocardioidaceae bacterium]|nr:iron chelate uptake ABC transporter family permease subunit [Nocardioidaceae bacterium]
MAGSALAGAAASSALVFGLAARGGLQADRLVLVGVGVSAAAAGVTTFLVVLTDSFNELKAITWLRGSTYGVTFDHLVPLALVLVLVAPLLFGHRRELDLLALDDDTPRVLGVRLVPTRLLLLGA